MHKLSRKTSIIICIGNRLIELDSHGPKVYDYLNSHSLPEDVELIDGGLSVLNLLGLINGVDNLIFVDSIKGYDSAENVIIMDINEIINLTDCSTLNHASGLLYLLNVIPELYKSSQPLVSLVGIQGAPNQHLIKKAANASLQLANVQYS